MKLIPEFPQEPAIGDKRIRVRPEHIHQALRQFPGIDNHVLARKLPLGVKDGEMLHGLIA